MLTVYVTVHCKLFSRAVVIAKLICASSSLAFMKRSKRADFCNTERSDFDALCAKADNELFQKILNSTDHVLHPLLPPPCAEI